jgi:ribonuclease HI
MLSHDTQARLDQARLHENDYRPNDEICRQIGDKVLIMVVAPAAVGKTTVMDRAVQLNDEFARVPIFSTREPRPDDEPGMFRLSPHEDNHVAQLLDKFETRQVVQYAIHPTQGTIYGTEARDYPARYNLLATLSTVVDGLRKLPFEQTHTIGLITDSAHWQKWFNDRYPANHPERGKRAREAVQSLEWLLSDQETLWLYNRPDELDETAQDLIDIVQGTTEPADLRLQAAQLLATARTL